MAPSLSSVIRLHGERHATGGHLASRPDDARAAWSGAFRAVRAETERRAAPVSPEDQMVQSMPDASPTKWHRAHTTWFFEQFLLMPHLPGYRMFDEAFGYLFNSYYVAAGPRHARPRRGVLSRPSANEVTAYRAHVDQAVEHLVAHAAEDKLAEVGRILEIGLHHEQQHQELILTDILHALAQNPLAPAYDPNWVRPHPHPNPVPHSVSEDAWDRADAGEQMAGGGFVELPHGIRRIGWTGEGFCFDNECPAHDVLLGSARIARRLVTNGQWLEFIADGGYVTPSLWLSDGWAAVEAEGWRAPAYWVETDGAWLALTLRGREPVDPHAAVTHVSYYEADAFARWAGKDLPTEAQWEVAARAGIIEEAFGTVWQWTRSAYLPYPGYRAADGALGEYNGKFMINQMVLRGSSLATPAGHARESYRNFFYPAARWQFSGVRLVEYPD
ncbi:MAG TPA: ergothioneine biosynthesis protein EgtB [Xanthobacteraceae bacterium]|nr:ergothioneine biosynthesis protein EgtB [Xanthobacteraceae bacterium]